MNYADIKYPDVANGIGVRVSLFVSGCEHYCKNCFNSEAWDFSYGKPYSDEVFETEIKPYLLKSQVDGLTILGGEPMHPKNVHTVDAILCKIKKIVPEKSIWIYSGYTLEELLSDKSDIYVWYARKNILKLSDILVDGRFVEEEKDLNLQFRGSRNQRILDLNQSSLKPILATQYYERKK